MDTLWSVNGESVEVALAPNGKGWKVQINGRELEVISQQPGRLVFSDGQVFDYALDWTQSRQQALVNHGGHSLSLQRQGSGQDAAGSSGGSSAPMNGQVSKILKAVGDTLEKGEVLLVLEAMKMENEVVAPSAGRLKTLHVSVGENVTPGQKLFEIEAAE